MGNAPITNTTNDHALRVAVIGSLGGVLHIVDSLEKSSGYTCVLAVAENYPDKNSFKDTSYISLKDVSLLRSLSEDEKNSLLKIPQVYSVSNDVFLRAFDFDWMPPKTFENIDLFLLACEDNDLLLEYKSSDYVSALLRHGVAREKIFIVPPVVYHAQLPIIEGGKLSPLCKNMNEVKPLLRYVEYHVTDFCNLKCKECTHLSNHVRELEFADIGGFRLALERLAEKFSNIAIFRLMGGEPLLCKNLHEYINVAHEIFPYCIYKL